MTVNSLCSPLSMFLCSHSVSSHAVEAHWHVCVYGSAHFLDACVIILSIGCVCVNACFWQMLLSRPRTGCVLLHTWLIARMNATKREKAANWRVASSFSVSQHWLLSGCPSVPPLCFILPPHHLPSHLLYLCGVVIWWRVSLCVALSLCFEQSHAFHFHTSNHP